MRSLLMNRLGRYGDADVVTECQHRFKAHVDGTESIPADLRAAVYAYVLNFLSPYARNLRCRRSDTEQFHLINTL